MCISYIQTSQAAMNNGSVIALYFRLCQLESRFSRSMSNASSMLNVFRAEVSLLLSLPPNHVVSPPKACAATAQALPVCRPQPYSLIVALFPPFCSPFSPLHSIPSIPSFLHLSLSAHSFPSPTLLSPLSSSDRSLVRLSVRPSPARHVSVRAPSVYVTRDTISPGSQNDTGARAARRRREGAARRRWRKTCARAETAV